MKISVIGTNGMLSVALTKGFYAMGYCVNVYGLDVPIDYPFTSFTQINLLKEHLDYDILLASDIIVYAAGAGVQAALSTPSSLMYSLNVNVPIEITLQLKKRNYTGKYISFGSYMEIGLNNEEGRAFTEDEVLCSSFPVMNDYALSKRLYGRYMKDFSADFTHWHFILPNMFSYNDLKPGTRLIPYTINYLQKFVAGKETPDPSFSAGFQTRQFILLEDILKVISKAIEKNMVSGVYNIGGGSFQSIRNLIEELFAVYKVPCKETFFGQEVRRDGDIKSLCIDGSKLQNVIDYLPETKLKDIIVL